jgi:hypothetical protein
MIFLLKWLSRSQTGRLRLVRNGFQRVYMSRGVFRCLCGHQNTPSPRDIDIGG